MDEVLLAERLYVLGRDLPETAYSAAVLLDMADRHMVRMDGPRLGPINAPESHPVLTQARLIITSADRFRTVDHWVHWIPAAMRQEEDGALTERIGKSLPAGVSADGETDELRSTLLDAASPSGRTALLVTVLHASRSVGALFDEPGDRDGATARAAEIASKTTATASSDAATQPVAAVRAAVFAALRPVFTTPSL